MPKCKVLTECVMYIYYYRNIPKGVVGVERSRLIDFYIQCHGCQC